MSGSTDSNSRIVFDLGLSAGHYGISAVRLEKVTINPAIDSPESVGISLFPNPVVRDLYYSSPAPVNTIELINVRGQKVLEHSLDAFSGKLNLSSIPKGMYYVIASFPNQKKVLQKIIVN